MTDGNAGSGGLGDSWKKDQQGGPGYGPPQGGYDRPPAGLQRPGGAPGFAGPGAYPAPAFAPQAGSTVGGAARSIGWALVGVCILAIIGSIGTWAGSTIDLGGAAGPFHATMNGLGHVSSNVPSAAPGSRMDLPHDGIVVTAFAVVIGILSIVRALGKAAVVAGIAAIVGGLIAVIVSVFCIHAYGTKAGRLQQQLAAAGGQATGTLSTGWGVWLVLIAGILLVLLGIAGTVRRR